MVIDKNGAVGIGIVTPAAGTKLHVNGPTMISDGTQGNGKIFVSDASGMGSWKQGSYITTFALNTGQSMVNISITPTQFATALGTFTKNEVNTNIEVILNTHIVVGDLVGANGVTFELRIDGNAFPNNMGRVIYWQDNNGTYGLNTYINVNINAIWTAGIPIGAHQITLWVYANGGSATNAYYNPGNYNNTSLIIKETR